MAPLLTVKQVAERLGVHPATVYQIVAAGRLRCSRVGVGRGRIRFSEEQVAAYLGDAPSRESATQKPPAPKKPVRLRHLRPSGPRSGGDPAPE